MGRKEYAIRTVRRVEKILTVPKKETITINAVHERDAEAVWKKLGLKSEEPCFVCGDMVTAKEFCAIAPYNGKVVVCCEKGHCFFEFNYKVKKH